MQPIQSRPGFRQMGVRRFGRVNWLGLYTLSRREIMRFLSVWQQTIFAPLMTSALFVIVFALALGQNRGEVMGLPYLAFLGPGILMMTVIQNAFANTSSSIMISKVQGNIVDVLMAPLSPGEMVLGYVAGGITRGLVVGLVAFLGGLILNVMPCVLPVLSIKLASVITGRDKSGGEIRARFLASAVGVMAFMWVLAAATFGLRQVGVTVGWGLQFQNPGFLALMVVILSIFAANMLGLFDISLPSRMQTRLADSGARRGYGGDFATGAFAAMLATPCSAPFLGTAIAFALTGGIVDIGVVFTGLGLGLATPYFAVAAYPRLALIAPKPGRWMIVLKVVLGLLLLLTAAWLVWVLSGVAGPVSVSVTVGLVIALIGLLTVKRVPPVARWAGIAVLAVAPIYAAGQFADQDGAVREAGTEWINFDRAAIARHVSRGETVFVDVTADWCLTCQANKVLVLDRDPVVEALAADGVIAMRADWTRPDEEISRYLAAFDRYGIPFNAVYGPGAPEGIVLPELLNAEVVMEALREAATSAVAAAD